MTQSAGIFSGKNIHTQIRSTTKKNEGSSVVGDQNCMIRTIQTIHDQDHFDFHHPSSN
ncbi:hypothetical protein [Thermoactinomyces sp. DSM 45891]|uniref:hypothetical protein n=1 Tax=Thermoactinomyces sp. DSM 45891 TaxID=1761907 RepID=UPI0015A56659|nr:hypothetical protein [Thermoactinomyces sp. DSM 45891]